VTAATGSRDRCGNAYAATASSQVEGGVLSGSAGPQRRPRSGRLRSKTQEGLLRLPYSDLRPVRRPTADCSDRRTVRRWRRWNARARTRLLPQRIRGTDHATVPNRHFRHFPADLRPPLAIGGDLSVCIHPSDGGTGVRILTPESGKSHRVSRLQGEAMPFSLRRCRWMPSNPCRPCRPCRRPAAFRLRPWVPAYRPPCPQW
jgi:hypothetical protein